ncbi:MAG: YibE/F family protein [Anaerolineae bacterium]|nr:YibE/F family protein [Anaerolineae bacterium]
MSKLERYLIGGIIALVVLAVVAIVLGRWLVPAGASPEEPPAPGAPVTESETMKARVVDILEEGVREPGGYPYQRVRLYVEDGSLAGQQIEIEEGTVNIISNERLFSVGDRVLLVRDETCLVQAGQETCFEHTYISDFVRTAPVLWIAALFVALVLLVGRGRGLRSLAGTLLSLVIILAIVLLIAAKYNPVGVSLVGSAVLLLSTTYLVYGWNYKAHAAVIGMMLSLMLTWVLAALFVSWAHLTGMGDLENASYLAIELGADVDFRGIVLAGITIGALGVLDDICVGQASAVFELVNANRDMSWLDLLRSSLNIGRDHIAAMVNTLLLAYVGASLPLMLVFTIYAEPLWYRINREPITEEIVRTLAGSLGLILAVPITGLVASLIARWAVKKERAKHDVEPSA